jgi:hypothetical protein
MPALIAMATSYMFEPQVPTRKKKRGATVPEVFIVESLGLADEVSERREGGVLAAVLKMCGKNPLYYYIRTKAELGPDRRGAKADCRALWRADAFLQKGWQWAVDSRGRAVCFLRGAPSALTHRRFALKCQQVSGLTFQYFTQLLQRAEANRACSARVQDRKVLRRDADALSDCIQLQLAFGKHHVEVHYNWHVIGSRQPRRPDPVRRAARVTRS